VNGDRPGLCKIRSHAAHCAPCIIDGEAVACDDNGLPSFNRIRYRRHDANVFLFAFDLVELNGDDLRRDPLEVRKATLANVLAGVGHDIWFNDHIEGDGPTVFKHACKLGLEGIVSKRKDSPYRSGRSPDWLKSKNPACAAVKRTTTPRVEKAEGMPLLGLALSLCPIAALAFVACAAL
jgi:bifunctional non-homologous end joining protein LigD